MSSCVTTPTATRTNLVTSETVSTSFTEIVTAVPGITTIITSEFCAETSNGTCALTSTELITSTEPGSTETITSAVLTTTIENVRTNLQTLFGTSCTEEPPEDSADPDDDDEEDQITTTDTTSEPTVTTPPPTTITSQSSTTLDNGSVSVSFMTVVSTPPAQTVNPGAPVTSDNDNDGGSVENLGAIIGGAVGGFFGLICLVLLIWFVMKRRRRWDDIFDKEDDNVIANTGRNNARFSLGEDMDSEPKPYQYGLLGHTSPPLQQSPPASTDADHSYTSAYANARPSMTNRTSVGPLLLPPLSGLSSGNSLGPTPPTTGDLSRPSTTGSMQPLAAGGYFERSGSPVGEPEPPRKLQIVNGERQDST